MLGYLIVWTLFSLMATLAQWGLHSAALLSSTMVSTSPMLGAALLIAAGLFQWTPLKSACLKHCRSPLEFLTRNWREGTGGSLLMGLRHGGVCTGCCWVLMALLFVAGVMNLLWVGLIAIFVLAEKRARGEYTGGAVPWGFSMADGHLFPAETEIQVAEIVEFRRAAGVTWRAIAEELNAEPGHRNRGRMWRHDTLIKRIGQYQRRRSAA